MKSKGHPFQIPLSPFLIPGEAGSHDLLKTHQLFKRHGLRLLVWGIMLGILYLIRKSVLLSAFWDPLKILVLLAGPFLYPVVLKFVLLHQLPPLTPAYIKKNRGLWIPGLLLACLPFVDVLILHKRILGIIIP